jgi:hypothetical protein
VTETQGLFIIAGPLVILVLAMITISHIDP